MDLRPDLQHTPDPTWMQLGVGFALPGASTGHGTASFVPPESQAKLNMMREALAKLDRQANEHEGSFVTVGSN